MNRVDYPLSVVLLNMAPSAITEDYYMILEVDQTATRELIVKSYRRLAIQLHLERNPKHDTTAKFQQVRQIQTCVHHCVDHG
jgi:preprotein translocase subunit Sec63